MTELINGYFPLVADAETFWGDEYTLRKVSSALYVRDPQFKAHGWSVILPTVSPEPKWAPHSKFIAMLDKLRDSGVTDDRIALVGWNLRFDGDILAQHYGFVPGLYVDVMGIARAVLGPVVTSFSLDSVSKYLGLSGKEKVAALYLTKNKRDLTSEELSQLGEYAKDDVRDTWAIFEQLAPYFPKGEYETLDWTIRMFTQPTLRLDADKLRAAHEEEVARKQSVFDRLGILPVELNSNKRLAETLISLGVDPPLKKSKTTGKKTFAFAAKDYAFVQLTQHENPDVAALVQARIDTKSSIAETRALSYLKHADFAWPVDLSYSGALQTHRLSGAAGAGGNCLTPDHEVLTPDGWVMFTELAQHPTIATWDYKTGKTAWEKVEVVSRDYDGPLVKVSSDTGHISLMATPDHRVATKDTYGPRLVETTAGGFLAMGTRTLPVAASLPPYTETPTSMTPAMARVWAMVHDDGSMESSTRVCVSVCKLRKRQRARELLDAANVAYKVYPLRRSGAVIGECFRFDFDKRAKTLSFSLLAWSLDARKAFVEELRYWDGYSHPSSGSFQWFTVKREHADIVQTLAHSVGMFASAHYGRTANASTKPSIIHCVNVRPRDYASVRRHHKETIDYSGKVFCLQTKLGGFFVRHRGAISLTLNCQNLGRNSPIRKAIRAPKDHLLIVSDLSNIELRICGQMAGERRIVDPLAAGRDLYCEFGTQLFARPITKKENPEERTTSKIAVLSCQYGSGAPTFESMYWAQTGKRLKEGEAADIVRTYRSTFSEVPALWKHYNNALQIMMRGGTPTNKMSDVPLEWAEDGFRGPSGLWVKYPDVRYTQTTFVDEETGEEYTKDEITFHSLTKMTPSGRKRTYGGHVTENACQFLAREVINAKGAEIRRAGLVVPMQVHDELVVVAHKSEADAALKFVGEVMNKRVDWWPELPIAAETKMHEIYGEAK